MNNYKNEKILLNFADSLISKEQMSKIKGGYGGLSGSCGVCESPGYMYADKQGSACENIPTPPSDPSGYNQIPGCYCPWSGGCNYLA